MRLTSVGSAALLSAVVISLTAPAAMAGDNGNITSFGFSVSPASVAPGGTVTLSANGCEVPSVTASSGVFDTVTLEEGHSATARVDPDARVGAQYDVTFECKGETGTTPLTISSPSKGVRAGLGGSITGMNTMELAAGGVLIAAALGGVIHLRRRASRANS